MRSRIHRFARLSSIFVGLVLCSLSAPDLAIAQVPYSITGLGTGVANAVNNNGVVVGLTFTVDGRALPVVWQNGTTSILPTLTGGSTGSGFANSVNLSGDIVGASKAADGNVHAVIWHNGVIQEIGTLPGFTTESVAHHINNAGVVVGTSDNFDIPFQFNKGHAFSWTASGGIKDVGTLPGRLYSEGVSVNSSGKIVGFSYSGDPNLSPVDAFLDNNGTKVNLGSLNNLEEDTYAFDINDSDQVVGKSLSTSKNGGLNFKPFLWQNGVITDLGEIPGFPGGSATSINNLGQVVGISESLDGRNHPFLYSNGSIVDLNSLLPSGSGWELLQAHGIDDRGDIVGYGTLNGVEQAFLLRPTITPEPGPVALLLGATIPGVAFLSRRLRRRKK